MVKAKSQAKRPPTSKLKRSTITGLAAAKVGLNHVGFKTKNIFSSAEKTEQSQKAYEEKVGKIIFSVLSQLRGTALKVSQLLSQESDILPQTVRDQLKTACYQVPPINRALVRKQIVQELGKAPNQIFKGFNAQAFAAASIGQVHRAKTKDDQLIAVKIQYPGIGATIESDLKMIEKLFWTLSKTSSLMPRQSVIDQALREMKARLTEEVDYHIEAENLKCFKEKTSIQEIVIPQVIDSISSKRVLSLEMLEGLHLDEWLENSPSQEEKDHFGQLLFDFFWFSFFKLQMINADPHPGNFLFMSDGKLGALDFGCVRKLSQDFVDNFSKMIPEVVSVFYKGEDSSGLFKTYHKLQFIEQDVSKENFDKEIVPYLKPYALWFGEAYKNESFDFKNKTPCPGTPNTESSVALKYLKGMFNEQFCFDRAHLGLMNLLTQIGAEIKTDWQKFRQII
ncbi:MAG: AarF/ABC1/UbiB kinase family protein [Kangiellaceae bacterium]|nr:AarF/ABC1/UbiB kinase family protein [Kangiellaceae bacterium]MCW8998798.1 AarF/ABC1/UbiB kinase family protein [Kangiellaceae bacterium]MCW9018404.1 AarF/ABC1/UbiB kinase family protein [Kangiellaceae bacterium]